MAEEAKNKKYLTLEGVRVSYRAKDDSIHLTSTDEDFPHGFHMPVQKGTFVEEQLRTLLLEHGHIDEAKASPTALLPNFVTWHDSYVDEDKIAPGFFPVGVAAEGGVVMMEPYTRNEINVFGFDLDGRQSALGKSYDNKIDPYISVSPHVLIAGATGGGKSVLLRNLIEAALLRSDHWDLVGIDLKQVEMKDYLNRFPIAHDLNAAVREFKHAHETMMIRYAKMEHEGVNHYLDLATPSKGVIVFVDEFGLLAPQRVKTALGRKEDEHREAIQRYVAEIARLGRAAGVHLIVTTQRPDPAVIDGEIKANFGARIMCGRMDSTPQEMILGASGPEYNIGTHRGRAYVRIYGQGRAVQVFFRDPR